jgi:hypothetical protein
MKPGHLRFALGPNWRRQPALSSDMTDAQLDAAIARGFAEKSLSREIDIVQELQQRTGAKLHLVIWEPPPLPAEMRQRRTVTAGRRLRGRDVPISARFLVAVLKNLAAQGARLDAVELSNEPDGDWNIRIGPKDYVALVKAVRKEARRRAIALPKIYGPATSSVATLRNYLRDAKVGQAIIDSVDILSVHGWDNPRRRDRFLELDALFEDLKRLRRKPALAITEYGLARPKPTDTSEHMNVKTRSPDNVANSSFFGSISARDLLRFYASGVGTIIHWEFRDESWGKASFGLVDESGKERPIYGMLRAISEYLAVERPRRIEPTTVNNLFVGSRPGRDVLWSANPGDSALDVVFGDGIRPIERMPSGFRTCLRDNGTIGLTVPPWSLVNIPIEKP